MMIGKETLYGETIQDIRKIIEEQDFLDEPGGTGANTIFRLSTTAMW